MKQGLSRRTALKNIVAGTAALGVSSSIPAMAGEGLQPAALKGNINHSVCRWCFSGMSVEELCIAAKEIGLIGIDLVGPADWPTLKKYGLLSTMCNGAEISIPEGWNKVENHARLVKQYSEMIPKVAEAGYRNLICFSGNRRGMDDETGFKNCVDGLKQVMPLAEKHGVVIVMELLNSKVNHKDYMCDRTWWGAELCKRLGSQNFKLLYDIYHMQIDEGDVIHNIRDFNQYIAHYHTAGVPGRHEIDESQELYYPAIMKAIIATGFKGYVAQEFIPAKPDKIASLREAIKICDV
ncbi:hydroxypyruvate isomerase family protein [Hufsiella ginkgonis]|uniref:TIM barrel protein n=1 Tax=Hufsiella ginkgonis TaxID=2695274 RepID=A0A7K1XWC4_9SPHI|nr:TIM barrel protein [Hufsiella ginkgonis]MXV15088.1 TIM barrel protein [Hufsiella ginkgonis]